MRCGAVTTVASTALLIGLAGCDPGGLTGSSGDEVDGGGGEGRGGLLMLLPWTLDQTHPVTQGHNGGSHTGVGAWAWDFGMPEGTPIWAAHDGTVRLARGDSSIGGCSSAYADDANYVIVDRGDGTESLYLHLSATRVAVGDAVERGQLVGLSGQSGWACGAHLHFQVQASPAGGGTESYWNQTMPEVFHDTGEAWDPPAGVEVTSKNGGLDLP